MPKLEALMGGGADYAQPTDHIFKILIPGDIESVRERLVHALERMGYRVVSEQPLIVKRDGPISSCSFDVLKCVKTLTIGLTAVNPTSTLATFDYEIVNSFVTKGDRQTTEREAEAIVALAKSRPETLVCARCGTNNSGGSHFCRVCGAPAVMEDPVELEVLRLTSGARPGYQFIVVGFISALLFAVVSVSMILFGTKSPKAGLILLATGEAFAACCFLYGMLRLHRTLNPNATPHEALSFNAPRELRAATTAALPPQPASASVTEGTTELLVPAEDDRVAVTLQPHKVETAGIGKGVAERSKIPSLEWHE